MNTGIYRLIFNQRLGMHVPVAERSTAHGKGDGGVPASFSSMGVRHAGWQPPRLRLIAALLAAALGSPLAFANPANPTVVSGAASFSQNGATLTVTNSPNAIINWNSFSIGQNEITRFVQQSSASAVLNRVTGQDPSQILGQLQSNGRVFLINPNGVLFGQGARIDVAGLVSSSLNISNADFLAGKLKFAGAGSEGAVKNAGDITTPNGGQVILIAPNVENSGVISSPNGEITLAAGHTVELADTLNPALRVQVTAPDGQAVNLGTLIAESGKIGMYAGLVTQSGTVSASSAVAEGGRIFLKGTQAVTLGTGSVTAADGTKGGEIIAKVEENGQLSGRVSVQGTVSARGDGSANSGGSIETSAAGVDVTGANVSAGRDGTWLIDPTDVTIDAAYATTIDNSLNSGTSITVQTTGTAGDGLGNGNITVGSAIAKTAGTDATLTLSAHNNIAVNASITSTSGKLNLNLYADSDAIGGGSTTLASGTTINANGGTTALTGGLALAGGTLSNTALTSATGATVSTTGNSSLNNTVLDVDLTVSSGSILTLQNGLTVANGHRLTLASMGNNATLRFSGSQSVGGSGEIFFGGTSAWDTIDTSAIGDTITLGSGITVHGNQIGSINGTVVNHGVINADTAGQGIWLSGSWTNSGTLKVSNGGTLNISGNWTTAGLGYWDSTGGTINFGGLLDNTGATLAQGTSLGLLSFNGATVSNGTIAGGVQLTGGNTFNGVTLDTDLSIDAGRSLTLQNGFTLTNGHKLTLGSTGGWSYYQAQLIASGTQTIGGNGEIIFGGAGVGAVLVASSAGSTLTIGPGITVHGGQSGGIGPAYGATANFINQGTITADMVGQDFGLSGNWTNTGTLKASNGGTLKLGGNWTTAGLGYWDSTGGTIDFGGLLDNTGATLAQGTNLGLLSFKGGTVLNGTIAGGAQLTGLASATFDGVTLDTDFSIADGSELRFQNGMTLANGHKLTLEGVSWGVGLAFNGSQTIGGSGEIIFGGTMGGDIYASSAGTTLTIGSGITVHGSQSGTLGVYGATANFVNQGTINADTPGQSISLSGNWTNTGTLKASNGGTLSVSGLPANAGVMDAGIGSSIQTSNSGLTNNGLIGVSGSLDLGYASSGSPPVYSLNSLTNNGTLNASSVTLTLNLDNQGTANLTNSIVSGNITNTGTLNLSGSVTAGGPSVSLDAGTLNLVSGATLTKDTGLLTWSGGSITGAGTLAFTNGGAFAFGGSGNRVLNAPNVTFAFSNLSLPNGSLTLQSGGLTFNGTTTVPTGVGLYLQGGLLTNNGPLDVSGTLGLYGGTLAGTGAINITGGTIDMPASSTVNWTATGPMTNTGTLNLSNRTITNLFTNQGTINSGGGLSFTQVFTNQGTFNANAGTTTFSAGFSQTAGSLKLNGGNVSGNVALSGGLLGGTGTITGNLNVGAATLAPGFSPGTISVVGNLSLGSASTTSIDLWGATPGTGYDVINVSGTANLNGTLNALLGNGYVPAGGASHAFLNAGAVSGGFAGSSLPAGFSLTSTATGLDLVYGTALAAPLSTPTASPLLTQAVSLTSGSVGLGAVGVGTPGLYASGQSSTTASSSGAQTSAASLAAGTSLTTSGQGGGTGSSSLPAGDLAYLFDQLINDASTQEWNDGSCLVCR